MLVAAAILMEALVVSLRVVLLPRLLVVAFRCNAGVALRHRELRVCSCVCAVQCWMLMVVVCLMAVSFEVPVAVPVVMVKVSW